MSGGSRDLVALLSGILSFLVISQTVRQFGRLGATDYIVKPVMELDFLERVAGALGEKKK